MAFKLVLLLKPFVYFALLAATAKVVGPSDRPPPGTRRLALVALARYAAGFVVGPAAVLFGEAVSGHLPSIVLLALGLAGFALWYVASRLAFGKLPLQRALVFAVAAEAVSFGMDFLLGWVAPDFRMC